MVLSIKIRYIMRFDDDEGVMNPDILRYKRHFVSVMLILGYAFMHTLLTGCFYESTLEKFIQFQAHLPFGQRLLVPACAHALHQYLGFSVGESFFLLECLFITLLFCSLNKLLRTAFNYQQALCLSWLFLLLLPLVTVVNYRFVFSGQANFFYPYDSASLFFMVLGFQLCLTSRFRYLLVCIFIATLNRESSLLLVCLIPILHRKNKRAIRTPFILACMSYLFARLLVYLFTHHLPGAWAEFYTLDGKSLLLMVNLTYLLQYQHIGLVFFEFAGLPLFWFALYDYIPLRFRPIKYILFAYFFSLLWVGKLAESRILSEIVVLIYFPVCLAVRNWCLGEVILPVHEVDTADTPHSTHLSLNNK